MSKKFLLFQVAFVVGLVVFIESVCFFILRTRKQEVGFMFNLHKPQLKIIDSYKETGLDVVDPLCGWAWSHKAIEERGYEADRNCAVLRSTGHWPAEPVKIFITGGSTSDLILKKYSWIVELQQIFNEKNINAVFYCGGVCGYNSWQELMKLLRDGIPMQPDIHISYAGANDCAENVGFVSDYENEFYETAMSQNFSSPLMPSTVYLIKSALRPNYSNLTIRKRRPAKSLDFWQRNMQVMSATAAKKGYHFVGILQPVLGMGNYRQPNAALIDPAGRSKQFEEYYPQAQEYIQKTDTTLFDFTHIFDTVQGAEVFVDFCHIDEIYQKTVACNVYEVLAAKGYIPAAQNK